MTDIKEIKITNHIEEVWPLFEEHRKELATHKHIMILKPDWDRYRSLEEINSLVTLALYDGDKIVGYSAILIYKNLHYSDLIDAFNDVLYVLPEYRKGRAGLKLIKMTEEVARQRGAHRILFHGKPDTVFSSLMPRMGYEIHDIVFGKEL
jgi:GNAT superfamily N-acetyltransferase